MYKEGEEVEEETFLALWFRIFGPHQQLVLVQ